jgi:hypothetical protein
LQPAAAKAYTRLPTRRGQPTGPYRSDLPHYPNTRVFRCPGDTTMASRLAVIDGGCRDSRAFRRDGAVHRLPRDVLRRIRLLVHPETVLR